MIKKYATDLKVGDQILDKPTGEIVEFDQFENKGDLIIAYAYTVEHGDNVIRQYDGNSIVRVVE